MTDGQRWTAPVQTGLPEGQTGQRQHRKEGCRTSGENLIKQIPPQFTAILD